MWSDPKYSSGYIHILHGYIFTSFVKIVCVIAADIALGGLADMGSSGAEKIYQPREGSALKMISFSCYV